MNKILIVLATFSIVFLDSFISAKKHNTFNLIKTHDAISLLSGNTPEDYDVVYPYIANSKGKFTSFRLQTSTATSSLFRHANNLKPNNNKNKHRLFIGIKLKNEELLLVLKSNRKFYARMPLIERLTADGKKKKKRQLGLKNCHFTGHSKYQPSSVVAISNCNGLTGLIRTKSSDYFIEPLGMKQKRNSSEPQPHIIYRVDSIESTTTSWTNISYNDFAKETFQKKTRSKREDEDIDIVVNASTKIYLETVIAADHSVVKFHGHKHTVQYIMTLMNIVSTIYDDPSLEGNIDIVVVKILLVDKSKHNVTIVKRNTRASLENVCRWVNLIHRDHPSETYDIAVFLTRLDIGGPAGYAPLSSICDSKRSCTVNKDEGLSSAFILAHEIAHVLGLSHDGDEFQQQNCTADGNKGSVMAPTVQATFNRYYWSDCSREQFHQKREMWSCLVNKPNVTTMPTMKLLPETKYSLDEQCRQEFGEGFDHCSSFPIADPCTNLWCEHITSPDVCKTKKGPPLDGTECGREKWCLNGICIKKKKSLKYPIRHNPRNGGWSEWSSFGHCSRTCGIGVTFRLRKCNNPEPAFGGKYCKGPAEEFRLCNKQLCPEITDFREEQCMSIKQKMKLSPHQEKLTWRPHICNASTICQLNCISKTNQEILETGENVVDGTMCSYDGTRDICVQGQCKKIGCDGALYSNRVSDQCGICSGNGSLCKNVEKIYAKTPKRRFVRIAVIPKRARSIEIRNTDGAPNFIVLHSRRLRQFFLNNRTQNDTELSFIGMGTMFNYLNHNNIESVTAHGPLLEEMIVLISVKRWKVALKVTTKYIVSTNKSLDSIVGPYDSYEWSVRGWTQCSRQCGGGMHSVKIACFNKRIKKLVSKRHCSLLDKPKVRQRICNNFVCSYKWLEGEWEYCSHTCGSKGTRHRQIHCVHSNSTSVRVKPNLCQGRKPIETQSCNIYPCPAAWQIGPWSECSASCGAGIQYRNVTCLPPENDVTYDCGDKPLEVEICNVEPCETTCHHDTSEVCKMTSLYRYCTNMDFYNYCCVSCAKYLMNNKL